MENRTSRFPLAHTYSIVARDSESGLLGVAVQSHWFSVGSLVTWAEAGVGVVATQSMVEVTYGPLGLDLMRAGKSSRQALDALLAVDEGAALRQVAMIDAEGSVATHTGERCIQAAGHVCGSGFSVQANMMLNESVWPAMAYAYQNQQGSFADRMVAALIAAQDSGGDIRGKQSAAILIVKGNSSGKPWEDRVLELRIEDHSEPVMELKRLVSLHQAYGYMNQGDTYMSKGKTEEAMQAYHSAALLAPQITEIPFWQAVTLAEAGKVEDALLIFKKVFQDDLNWLELLKRLPASGLFQVAEDVKQRVYRILE